jgi:hypothetical protein
MSEDLININLTETEIDHILDALDARIEILTDSLATVGDPMVEDEINALTDLSMDLFEAKSRRDDGWGSPPAQRFGLHPDAALDMVQAGIAAREQTKATSMAAQRRQQTLSERLMEGTTGTLANDPIDW